MKEKLLVLAKAAPVVSSKYEHLVCVGGITENGEWRRVYPIPLESFWKGHYFKKKFWIEYKLQSGKPSNHRLESRKLYPETIKQLNEEKFTNIRKILLSKLTTLEELRRRSHKEVSMGVIKPKIIDFYESKNKHYEEMKEKSEQRTLEGKSTIKIEIPEMEFSYVFKCSKGCPTQHDLLCEDWELAELYRHCEAYRKDGTYKSKEEVIQKVRQKMLNEMLQKREIYFIVGTHFLYPTYMVIGIVYPRKNDVF